MGTLQDFSVDQLAGAAALILGSCGGLLMIIWKSRCREISCRVCFGLYQHNCIRDVVSDDEGAAPEPEPEPEPRP
jgi:hypothetical protein